MGKIKRKTERTKEFVKKQLKERRKRSKLLLKEKRARLIVRNLPFEATEENLKEYFGQYGEVTSVELLKKPNGKLKGCAFIQFSLVQKAAKAQHHTNKKQFMNREIYVDFVRRKDQYEREKKLKTKEEVKQDPEVKTEDEIVDVDGIKEEGDDVEDLKMESDDEETDMNLSDLEETKNEPINQETRAKVISNDISEGRTVFVKNVPFNATNEDLKQCMRQFGPIFYALICVDKLTEHSKGTAFVKFQNTEDAEKALQAGTELSLLGNVLDCQKALSKDELQQKENQKKEEKKTPRDSRNLYLVKEGVILAGTKAAESVSASDMAKRLQLEQVKTQLLRNLNMFVSKERLVIHNLPSNWDDLMLRQLVKKFAGAGAVITEARVMRDMRNLNADGIGRSKEYGFVSFKKHEHALNTLRALNNNPNIFSEKRRPIVTFSIENRTMIKAKQNRLQKSRLRNPTSKNYKPDLKNENDKKTDPRKQNKNLNKDKLYTTNNKPPVKDEELKEFIGVLAKPGVQKMRSRYKLTTQAKLHFENLKKEKKKMKSAKKSLTEKKKDFIRQPKQKINKKKMIENDDFSKLVNSYKQKMISASSPLKSKWYSDS